MATVAVFGVAQGPSGPVNGVPVDLWLWSRFTTGLPAVGGSPPGGAADYGPVTTSSNYGSIGGWEITGVNEAMYVARAVISGTNYFAGPFLAADNSDIMHLSGNETASGIKTLASLVVTGAVTLPAGSLSPAALSAPVPIASGGTGSTTQNFVDLTTNQSIGGVKTLTAQPVLSGGLNVSAGPVAFPAASINPAAIAGLGAGFTGAALALSQTFTGQNTFDGDILLKYGRFIGYQMAASSAPTVTAVGATGGTTRQYQIVKTSADGRDSIPSPTGQITNGNATLNNTTYDHLTWASDPDVASYTVLFFTGGTWQKLAGPITTSSWDNKGTSTPSAYTAASSPPGGEITAAGAGGSGRYLGVRNAVGPPTYGPWVLNDHMVDNSGRWWFCSAAGSPGTWVEMCRKATWYHATTIAGTTNVEAIIASIAVVDPGYPYRIAYSAGIFATSTVGGDYYVGNIRDTNLSGGIYRSGRAGQNVPISLGIGKIDMPSGGGKTLALTVSRYAGSTGNLNTFVDDSVGYFDVWVEPL